jgi:hypothetical protein
MSFAVATETEISAAIADEFRALADLLEGSPPEIWDAPSLCEGWRPPGGVPRDALTHCIIHGPLLTAPAQSLALILFGRTLPAPRLTGPAAPRFTRKPARRTAGSNGELFERLTGHGWPLSAGASPACLTREEERSSVRAGLGSRISGGLSACCS